MRPSDPRNNAEALVRAGRLEEAIALLRAAAERTPADPAAWTALARTLAAANRPDLALDAWERALTLDSSAPSALAGKGRALQALARPEEARAAFEAALAAGDKGPEARYGLALIAFDTADYETAAAHAKRLPAAPATAWLKARIDLARGDPAAAKTGLERLLKSPGLDESSRSDALLLLGQTLDQLGDTTTAFKAAMDGKTLQRRLFAGRAAGRETETTKLLRLATWFGAAKPWRWTPEPARQREAAGHVFLVGFPRSGTTLLEQALAANFDIASLEEAPTLADAYQEFLRTDAGCERLGKLTAAQAESWRRRYWEVVREHGVEPRRKVFLDKAPAGTINLPLVARLFPDARILFAIRDPRDVVLSCAMNAFQMNALTYEFTSLETTAACYAAAMRLAEIYRRVLPLRIHEVRYERLTRDFGGELAMICRFMGIDYRLQMIDVEAATRGRTVRTPSATQVRGGLDRGREGRWRAYAAELAPVQKILAPWVRAFGYPPT
ncbi:MAG TPA: sulfotransferase [Caulobacteraceae bacterium]